MSKLSIITSAFNVKDSIHSTINSLKNQSCKSFQWIIIDGGSTDGSQEVYKNNSELINVWLSETDSGIYEAWNKALKYVQGEWVLFLGAGDWLESNYVIRKILDELAKVDKSVEFVCGDIYLINKNFRKKISGDVSLTCWDLGLPKLPPHPAVLHRAKLFDNGISFDQSYKIAADSKFLIEYMNVNNYRHINVVITNMTLGGISSRPESWGVIAKEKLRIRRELQLSYPSVINRIKDFKLYMKSVLFFILGAKLIKLIVLFKRR